MSLDGADDRAGGAKGTTQSRWQKGQSGNPRGRPKKCAAEPGPLPTHMADLLIAEAARPVTLSEGGNPITLPAGLAVIRATVLSAIKGNAHAQRTVLQLVGAAEAAAAKLKRDDYAAAMALKMDLEHQRSRWLAQGKPESEMPVHPLDIELDQGTGTVANYLLLTEDSIAARTKAVALRDYVIERWPALLEAAREGDDLLHQMDRERALTIIDVVNGCLPQWRRRSLPSEGVVPPNLSQSPEKIWMAMSEHATSIVMRKGGQDKSSDEKDGEGE